MKHHSVSLRLSVAAGLVACLLTSAALADDAASPIEALRAYAETHDEQAPASEPAAEAPRLASVPLPPVRPMADAASPREKMMPLIEQAARDHNIPPALLDAVVRIESRYNPNVRNGGAIGLMQIKLATARGIGFTGDAQALSRPETNLQWGAKYLARAYQLSDGDTCLTLARYQGGHQVAKMGPAGKAYCAKVRTVLAQLN